jgi:TonB family protein
MRDRTTPCPRLGARGRTRGCAFLVSLLLAACGGERADSERAGRAPRGPEEPPPGVAVPPETPFAEPPRLRDAARAESAFTAAAESLGARGPGRMLLWLQVDTLGRVTESRLARRSSWPALDERALVLAAGFRFEPARSGGGPVPVWVQLPIDLDTAGRATPDTTAWRIPRFTPFREPPRIADRAHAESLSRAILAPVARAGAQGTVAVDVYVTATGAVGAVQVAAPSGHPELDRAVRVWVTRLRFTPPIDTAGQPTAAWVQFPVRVASQGPD